MKSGSIAKDIIQVIGIALLLTVVLTLLSVGASLAIGIPGASGANGTPGTVNLAAIIPTSVPPTATPTEIPCTAPEWWSAHSAAMGELFANARTVTLTTKVPDVLKAKAALEAWQKTFEADVAPPCANDAKTAVLNAGKAADDLYSVYSNASTPEQRAQQTVQLADKLLVIYDEVDKLKLPTTDAWLVSAKDYSRGDCPAARWYTEQIIAKGYNAFIKSNPKLDITKLTLAQKNDLVGQFRTLQSSLNTDKDKFPECVKPATDDLITYFKAGGDALNSALNNDLASIQGYLTAMPTALNAFYAKIKALDPTIVTS